jgi:hypothetical protein
VLLDVEAVPYVPEGFTARNRPEPVSLRLLCDLERRSKFPLIGNPLQEHTALYRSYPPQPDIPRSYHLLPSASVEAAAKEREAQELDDPLSSETTESDKTAGERARKDNSSGSSVELTETLPQVPQGRQVARKRKAHATDPAG